MKDKKSDNTMAVTVASLYKQNHNNLLQGQVYAVNPLAPFSSVTRPTVTQATTITQTVEKEPLYYWPLDGTGLTGSLQYQWNPAGVCLDNQLASPNTSQVAGSLFPSENIRVSNSPPSQFGSIGESCGVAAKAASLCNELVSSASSVATTTNTADGGYSLFSSNTHSLFGDSLLSGGFVTSAGLRNGAAGVVDSLVNTSEGSYSPTEEEEPKEFDEWPAF